MKFLEYLIDAGIDVGDGEYLGNDPLEEEIRLAQKTMEKQMENDLGCDLTVAKYALAKVDYCGVEEATEFIFGSIDRPVMNHPFFGYTSGEYQPIDNEILVSEEKEKCFVCEQTY